MSGTWPYCVFGNITYSVYDSSKSKVHALWTLCSTTPMQIMDHIHFDWGIGSWFSNILWSVHGAQIWLQPSLHAGLFGVLKKFVGTGRTAWARQLEPWRYFWSVLTQFWKLEKQTTVNVWDPSSETSSVEAILVGHYGQWSLMNNIVLLLACMLLFSRRSPVSRPSSPKFWEFLSWCTPNTYDVSTPPSC